MRVLAVIFGIILLLPGLCSLRFMAAIRNPRDLTSSPILLLWLICFGVSFGGIIMIWNGLRRRRPPPSQG
jgi:hypothetical protein